MKFLGSKKIETERLILRATEESDLKTLWEILCISEVNKYYLTSKLNSDWELELPWQMKKLERAKNNDVFCWSIVLKEGNKCIGQITAQEGNAGALDIRDIGWFINPKFQRNGYAYEVASAIIDYMFDQVDINAFETCAAICNPASWRLMEKLGFLRKNGERLISNYTFGGIEECYVYKLTKEEYLENKKC